MLLSTRFLLFVAIVLDSQIFPLPSVHSSITSTLSQTPTFPQSLRIPILLASYSILLVPARFKPVVLVALPGSCKVSSLCWTTAVALSFVLWAQIIETSQNSSPLPQPTLRVRISFQIFCPLLYTLCRICSSMAFVTPTAHSICLVPLSFLLQPPPDLYPTTPTPLSTSLSRQVLTLQASLASDSHLGQLVHICNAISAPR